jgi:hypothetical protein
VYRSALHKRNEEGMQYFPKFLPNYTHDNLVEIAGQNEETGFRATVDAEVGGSNPIH